MSKKHNTKHSRGTNVRYGEKVREGIAGRLADPVLSDGRRASAKR